jgi:two-component system, NtrC family, sensor kinase
MSPSSIVLSIVVTIATLGGVAIWDDTREAEAALDDFGHEQGTLANGLAAALKTQAARSLVPVALDAPALRTAFAPVSEPETVALLKAPGQDDFITSTGKHVWMPALELDGDTCWIDRREAWPCWRRVTAEQAALLALPLRTAMAGISGFVDNDGQRWRVAVVATARRERDREKRAQWRLLLGFVLSSGLVLAFGTLALRMQRSELAFARELAVKEAVRARDERLVRADKLAMLGALATGIAHEVSTPLGVILGRAEQLAPRVEGDERARRAVTSIAEQAQRIGRIVQAFLTLARGGTPSLERVAPAGLAKVAIELVEHRFHRAGVGMRFAAQHDLPQVACDARLLEQALVNLLLNACDACDPGGRVELRVERSDDGKISFVVVDDGEGITQEDALRATEPFFTTKPEGKGTGLGLAITNEIVLHHQGKLTIAPRSSGHGTEARIDLSVAEKERS